MRLLCVTAHPDDEAGAFGGSLLRYAGCGVETHVICLTEGRAATYRGTARTSAELAATRRQEFAAACRHLNVTTAELLDYPDGALDSVDFQRVTGELVRRIRQTRPDVLMTFGAEGALTAHPDHSMAGLFATAAFHWAGRDNRYTDQLRNGLTPHRVRKLYYATALFTLPDRQPVSPTPVTTVIDIASCFDRKIEAFKQHTSQAPLFPTFENMVRKRGKQEWFHLAATTEPREMERETDLFEGICDL